MRRLIGLLAVILAACSSGDETSSTPTITEPPTPEEASGVRAVSFVTPATPLVRGGALSIPLALTRHGAFSGPVELSLATLPTGITGTVSPSPLPPGATSAVVALNATALAPTGPATITLRARGSGSAAERTFDLTVNIAERPAFALIASAVTVRAGESAISTLTIARTGGFSGAVQFSSTATAGIAVAFTPASAIGNSVSASITVDRSVPAGVYAVTIRGSSTEPALETTVVAPVTVTAAAPIGGVSLAVTPNPLPVTVGQSANASIAITRTGGFTGAVRLETSGVPSGITATLSTSSTAGTTASLSVAAANGIAAGAYTFALRGSATGIATVQQTVTVTVSGSNGGGSGIRIRYCPDDDQPLWFAVQDGSGAWQRVTGTGGVFAFDIQSTRGGFAALTESDGARTMKVSYLTRDEMVQRSTVRCAADLVRTRTVSGTVASLAAGQSAGISLASSVTSVRGPGSQLPFTVDRMVSGPTTMLSARLVTTTRSTGSGTTTEQNADRIVIRRNINPPSGGTLPVIDFASAEAISLVTRQVQVTDAGNSEVFAFNAFYSFHPVLNALADGFAVAVLSGAASDGTSNVIRMPAVPATAPQPEVHVIQMIIGPLFSTLNSRTVQLVTAGSANLAVSAGAGLSNPTITSITAGAVLLPRASGAVQAEYDGDYVASFESITSGGARVEVLQSRAYRSASAQYQLIVPDLSGVSGWNASYGVRSGGPLFWTLSATSDPQPFNDGTPQGGQLSRSATTANTIAPPASAVATRAAAELSRRRIDVRRQLLRKWRGDN